MGYKSCQLFPQSFPNFSCAQRDDNKHLQVLQNCTSNIWLQCRKQNQKGGKSMQTFGSTLLCTTVELQGVRQGNVSHLLNMGRHYKNLKLVACHLWKSLLYQCRTLAYCLTELILLTEPKKLPHKCNIFLHWPESTYPWYSNPTKITGYRILIKAIQHIWQI